MREEQGLAAGDGSEPGVTPVGEIEILRAIGDRDAVLVDMRSQEEYLKRDHSGIRRHSLYRGLHPT